MLSTLLERAIVVKMLYKIYYFLPLIICILVQEICAEKYILEYLRHENEITLRCKVGNTSMTANNVSFWINMTEKIDIQSINSAYKLFGSTIQFVLTPQYFLLWRKRWRKK